MEKNNNSYLEHKVMVYDGCRISEEQLTRSGYEKLGSFHPYNFGTEDIYAKGNERVLYDRLKERVEFTYSMDD